MAAESEKKDILFNWKEAASILKAELYMPQNSAEAAGFTSVSVDSRGLEKNALFIALKGERTDGHNFLESAFSNGAAGALVCKNCIEKYALCEMALRKKAVLLIVDDTLFSLQKLAKSWLGRFPNLLRIGITGSSGKTTTKEIAAAIIGKEKRVVYNAGNLNSDIGLPLAVFQTREFHEAGVFELGMNRKGEIAEIASVLLPTSALITNTGSAHIGIIGSKEGIAKEKKDIFSFFSGTETAFIPEKSEAASFLAEGVKGKVVFYSFENSGIKIVKDKGIEGWELLYEGKKFLFSIPGKHNLENAAAALMLSRHLGLSAVSIREGLSVFRALSSRSEITLKTIGTAAVTVINDCYNANPESMERALSFFEELYWNGDKITVLGEMMELGASHKTEHEKLLSRLNQIKAKKKYFYYVTEKEYFSNTEKDILFFNDIEKLKLELKSVLQNGALLLLKASRICALERIF